MRGAFLAVALCYPLLVFAGSKWLDARILGLVVAAFVLARLVSARTVLIRRRRALLIPTLGVVALFAVVITESNDARYLFALPALVNAVLLVTFAASLARPPSIVETLARVQVADLSSEEVTYCRSVTRVWCGFFVLNGAIIVWLAVNATPAQWALYTGLLSYVLIGLVFSIEYVYRHYRFRRYLGAPLDALLRRFFPPREIEEGRD